jgi:hypothetical protein
MLKNMDERSVIPIARHNWRELYNDAVAEASPEEQKKKIDLANAAIHQRLYELANDDGMSGEEQQAILDALQTMQAVKELKSAPSADEAHHSDHMAQEGAA